GSSVTNDGQQGAGRGNGGAGLGDGGDRGGGIPEVANSGGRGGGIPDFGKIPEFVTNSGSNGGNNGNRNINVYGDNAFNTGFKDQEGSSSSLKVDIPKM
ncbi:hypothetical protein A2U01_0073007, partial [Trifolium medium]|nr:hypothetical protein [Trifolium medium]